MDIEKSSRHQYISGKFGEYLLCNWLSRTGFEVILEPAEEGGFVVHCPALKGCHSEGDTEEEALQNIQEAAEGYFMVAGERNA